MSAEKPFGFEKDNFTFPDSQTTGKKDSLSFEQRAAIQLCIELGKKIQEEFPQIAIEYANGITIPELLLKYNIADRLGIASNHNARISVLNALRGTRQYPGLIVDPEVSSTIGRKHKQANAAKVGIRSRDQKLGIFAMDPQRKLEVAKASGIALQKSGKGIHAQSIEDKKNFGTRSAIKRGFVPFSREETDLITKLSSRPEFKYGKRINTQKIAEALNSQVHGGQTARDSAAISRLLSQPKRRAKKNSMDTIFHEGAD